jgi:hypothetical protein
MGIGALTAALLASSSVAWASVPVPVYYTQWEIVSNGASYDTTGNWTSCGIDVASPGQSIACGSLTVPNSVSGSVGVSLGVLSVSVGYNVGGSELLEEIVMVNHASYAQKAQYQITYQHDPRTEDEYSCVSYDGSGSCTNTGKSNVVTATRAIQMTAELVRS